MSQESSIPIGFLDEWFLEMSELKYWAVAFAVMSIGSLVVASIRLFRSPFFVVEFELCIFYLPTSILGLVCLRLMKAGARSRL